MPPRGPGDGVSDDGATPGAPPATLPPDPLSDDLIARTVRRRTALAGAASALVLGLLLWMGWDGDVGLLAVPGAMSVYVLFLLARVALNPLRYRHLAKRSPLQHVLDAGGVPEEFWDGASTPAERRVVVRDLMDELGDDAEGFWNTRFGKSLGRVVAGVGTGAWLAAGGVALRFDGWASAAVCLAGSLVFALPLAWGMRDEHRRARAIELLRLQAGGGGEHEDGRPVARDP